MALLNTVRSQYEKTVSIFSFINLLSTSNQILLTKAPYLLRTTEDNLSSEAISNIVTNKYLY